MGAVPRIVIVGAGFGGVWAMRKLAGAAAELVMVDTNNHHTFLALLYQVAAAELAPEEIAYPVRGLLRGIPRARFVLGRAEGLDLEQRLLRVGETEISYDYLVLALGSTSHFFGVAGAAEHSFRLKTLDQGIVLRNHVLCCFERAANEADPAKRRQALTFAVVGGGAMGVEFAGALAELIRGPFRKDYPTLDFHQVRVVLLEGTDHLLPEFEERLQRYAVERLKRMGVEVRLGSMVENLAPDAVNLSGGEIIRADTAIWTAGVRGVPLAQEIGLPTNRQGRVPVLPTLQVPGHPEVYVVGDLASLEQDGLTLPMVAPVAIQQGTAAAQNIRRQMQGLEPVPFRYRDRGRMATIGRNAAVAQVAGRGFTGFVAWLLWLVVHLFNLIGFRNRLIVMINWFWDYIVLERAIRLIVPSPAILPGKPGPCGDVLEPIADRDEST